MQNDNSNKQQGQQQGQQPAGEQNPTLHQPGTQVADYGNVTGGSADESTGQEQETGNRSRPGENETIGNP